MGLPQAAPGFRARASGVGFSQPSRPFFLPGENGLKDGLVLLPEALGQGGVLERRAHRPAEMGPLAVAISTITGLPDSWLSWS